MRLSAMDIAAQAMSAQMTRLNMTASNMANQGQMSGSAQSAYRAAKPVFATFIDSEGNSTVRVRGRAQAGPAPVMVHQPGHPLADANGNVWQAGVDPSEELVEMVEAARQYQNNVEVFSTAKTLTLATLRAAQ